MASPPSAELLANHRDGKWIWEYNMATWKPKGKYPDVTPYDRYMIQLSPPWSAYLKARALEQPKPPVPEFTHSEPYFTIKKSPKGGHGAFASQDIPGGIVIHRESPLLSTMGYFELISKFRALTDEQKSIFVGMASLDYGDGDGSCELANIFGINCFQGGQQSRVFAVCCRFNHACMPRNNVSWQWNESFNQIILKSRRAIKKDEELTISYGHDSWELPRLYGFVCDCGCDPNKRKETVHERRERERKNRGWNPMAENGGWRNEVTWRRDSAW